MSEKEILRINDNLTVILDKAQHFKSTTFNLYIMEQLGANATKFALLPLVLKHGSKNMPTLREIESRLDNMYGAQFNVDVFKKGNIQIADYNLSVLNDKYADGSSLIEDSLKFLSEILFNPLIVDNKFKQKYVEIDKDNLKKMIEARINDKRIYAVERCIELMCKDDPYGIYPLGKLEDMDSVDENNLAEYYNDLIGRTKMVIVVTGNYNPEEIVREIKDIIKTNSQSQDNYSTGALIPKIDKPKKYHETMDVMQGKLSIGYTDSVDPSSDEYFSLLLMNCILGGGPQSKLFANVREKESLAYYASSRLDKFKGILEIYCGIEVENYESALKIIDKQIDDIKEGKISDHEIEASKAELEYAYKSISDSPDRRANFYLSQLLTGDSYNLENYINKISDLNVDDVVNAAKKLSKHTIYFMENK
jgi:predicted Zn-dependent peptidase